MEKKNKGHEDRQIDRQREMEKTDKGHVDRQRERKRDGEEG